ncbi:MAG: DNA polymerase III subunit delta [Chloroflexi bacterium]|nr:DNA polymerase III subunit delta [Chloroflexota bacterium]
MLHILYGADDFSIQEALQRLKALIEPQELLDANVTRVHVSSCSLQQLLALCNTVPFLASGRMVIVEGLLTLFESQRASRRGRGGQDSSSSWLSIVEHIATMPPSTDLVVLDGEIKRGNALLRQLSPLGQVKEFPALNRAGLNRWIQERAAERSCTISREGVRLLAALVGSNLWVMSSEIEKLSLYCQGRTVDREDVQLLVSFARDISIFNAVDAILEGDYHEALRIIRRLLMERGSTGTSVVAMVGRQVRLLLLAKDMERRGVSQGQIGARLGVQSDWVLNKVREQGRRHSAATLESLLKGLLETDRAIKTGRIAENEVGEFLVEVFAGVSSTQRAGRR